ncbi:MAG: hypothetical protein B7Z54_09395, partial [Sphingobacteriales bacterium 12-47-4]
RSSASKAMRFPLPGVSRNDAHRRAAQGCGDDSRARFFAAQAPELHIGQFAAAVERALHDLVFLRQLECA